MKQELRRLGRGVLIGLVMALLAWAPSFVVNPLRPDTPGSIAPLWIRILIAFGNWSIRLWPWFVLAALLDEAASPALARLKRSDRLGVLVLCLWLVLFGVLSWFGEGDSFGARAAIAAVLAFLLSALLFLSRTLVEGAVASFRRLGWRGAALVAAGLLAVGTGLVYQRQRFVFLGREAALERRLARVQQEIRELEAVAGELEAFRGKVAQVEAQLESLKSALPLLLEPRRVEEELRGVARGLGMRVHGVEVSERSVDSYIEGTFTLAVEGSGDAAERFASRIVEGDQAAGRRLYCVDDMFLPGPQGTIRVRAFSYQVRPPAKQGGVGRLSDADPSPAWLFSLAEQRERIETMERRLAQLQVIRQQVEALQAKEKLLADQVNLIERVHATPIPRVETQLRPGRLTVAELQVLDFVTKGRGRLARVSGSYGTSVELIGGERLSDGIVKSVDVDKLIVETELPMPGKPPLRRQLRLARPQRLPLIALGRDTTRITSPLLKDGTPDYGAWLNQKYGAGVTRENNAAIPLNAALGSLVEAVQTFWDGIPHEQWARTVQVRPWSEAECPACARRLSLNEKPLASVAEAVRRPRYFAAGPAGSPISQRPVNSLLRFRLAANALAGRGMLRLGRGDVKGASEDALTEQRLSLLLSQGPTLIERLIAIAIRGIGVALLPRLAASSAAPAELGLLLDDLRALPEMSNIAESIDDTERLLALERLLLIRERTAQGRVGSLLEILEPGWERGSEWSRVPAPEVYLLLASSIDWAEALRIENRRYDLDLGILRARSPGERKRATAAAEAESTRFKTGAAATLALLRKSVRREDTRAVDIADAAEKLGLTDAGRRQLANVPLSASGFAFVRSGIAGNEAEAQFRLAVLAVALAAHKLEKGGFPASLAGLAPGLLKGYLALDQPLPGYALRYHARSERRAGAPTVDSYAVTAAPEEVGQTGNRGFCVDSTGAIRFSTDGSAPKIVGGICDASVPLLR